jgi:tetratricopeptide (TPR) repeat protein
MISANGEIGGGLRACGNKLASAGKLPYRVIHRAIFGDASVGASSIMNLAVQCLVLLLFAVSVTSVSGQERDTDLDRYSDRARQALAGKEWVEAAQALEHLARLAPEVAEVQANLGLARYFDRRPTDALIAFERARKRNPALPQVNVMIGLCDADPGRYREAVALLARAFEHPPANDTGGLIGLHLERAYAELKQFDQALAAGEELVRRYPNDPEILYQLSRLHADRPFALMSKLVRMAPDSAWTHYANTQVQESLDRFDTAEQEYSNALQRDPRMLAVHYHLGRVILRASRTTESIEKARREFEQELAISPGNADTEYELGEIDREQGCLGAAVGHFNRALHDPPEFVEAQVGIANTLMKLGPPGDALPHLAEAARLDPGNKIPHYLLASAAGYDSGCIGRGPDHLDDESDAPNATGAPFPLLKRVSRI